ncbi:hypothetical protein ACHWQZ_G001630 [Mnemiopsis leidyi]
MEVMATHNMSHESLNSHEPLQLPPTPDSETMQTGTTTSALSNNGEAHNTIGCQTALSYARQDTLVPLTALLQLVNNSILTVMENIEKVLLVNSSEEGLFSVDGINTVWNIANSNNSLANSPTNSGPQERSSPSVFSDSRETESMGEENEVQGNDRLLRPIVIQDRFRNSLEIPNNNDHENISQPPEKKMCTDNAEHHQSQNCCPTQPENRSPGTPTTQDPARQDPSLSPTVNVAGSLTKYICPYCYKVFNWKTNMNRHISVTHLMKPKPTIKVPIMRKSKPYTCPICGNTFAWRSNMNRHILHLHKIDHKQLNKLLLSDIRGSDQASAVVSNTQPTVVTSEPESYSSLGSLTMLPQVINSFKTVAPSPPPTSVAKPTFTPNSPDHLTFLYRNHKALLESVKKEQVPIHVKEAALTSFYQNNKGLFEGAVSSASAPYTITTPTTSVPSLLASPANIGLLTPPKSEQKFSPPTSNLSALYQKALLEQRGISTSGTAAATTDITSIYQNHRAMLDTVSLLSNLNSMNVSNGTSPDVDVGIKLEGAEK